MCALVTGVQTCALPICLTSLPQRERLAGIAEIIKYGRLGDAGFFAWLEQNLEALLALDEAALRYAIRRSCEMKAAIVAQDERESQAGGAGPRALLNLGHTFAHAIETHTNYTEWLHGEAVAVGLCMAADMSRSEEHTSELQSLMRISNDVFCLKKKNTPQ